MQFTKTFWKLYDAYEKHPRYIDSEGGTRSSKTYSALQLLILLAESDKTPTITSVVSETLPHLKRGAIRDFRTILGENFDDNAYNKTDGIYTFPNGSIIEFFSCDSSARVHGPGRDRLFINESQNVSYDVARQLFTRTRGLIILDYNPTHAFWAHEHIAPRPECIHVHSTYKDNPYLTPEQIYEIESNKLDANWWRVYGEGKVGNLDGLVYDFEQIDALPDREGLVEVLGMDFGFTNDPTTLIHVYADTKRKIAYIKEEIYKTRMLNSDIIEQMAFLDVKMRRVPIYADCAEPKSIAEIGNAGYNVHPCKKSGAASILEQIHFVRGWKLCVTKDSINTIKELRNYTWAKDKDGKSINTPIDKFNHALDALRYAIFTHFAVNAGTGKYVISF